jgi:DNA-binding MarR family transcriptional regulator
LEEAGFVTRSRSEADRRVTIVSLTPAGRDLEPKVQEVWRKLEQITTGGLTEPEKASLVTLLRKATPNVD